jgi:hypothetical protein
MLPRFGRLAQRTAVKVAPLGPRIPVRNKISWEYTRLDAMTDFGGFFVFAAAVTGGMYLRFAIANPIFAEWEAQKKADLEAGIVPEKKNYLFWVPGNAKGELNVRYQAWLDSFVANYGREQTKYVPRRERFPPSVTNPLIIITHRDGHESAQRVALQAPQAPQVPQASHAPQAQVDPPQPM